MRDIVLVGGGHSHVQVLRRFGMHPLPGARLTIVSREVLTPYSGMLPGHVAGFYARQAIHIDLARLAAFAGARLVPGEVTALDLESRRVVLADHPPLRYDLLSLNTGAAPAAAGAGTRVKPIGGFLPQLDALRACVRPGATIALVGGGAGGVELALALRRVLDASVRVLLVTETLLADLPVSARKRLDARLRASGIVVHEGFPVTHAERGILCAADGRALAADHVVWATGVVAPDWPRRAGLATDDAGFVRVDAHLRSLSHREVFAAGDVACLEGQPRPKAGVFAVRAGPVLAENLRRATLGTPLARFRAQRAYLVIVGTGDGRAVATRNGLAVEGAWVWRWKDWIDRRFMARFAELPEMPVPAHALAPALAAEAPDPMRCGGCGAKLGAAPLERVLARLPAQTSPRVAIGIGEDAAVVRTGAADIVLTVDGFRSMLSDPYRFGRITAHHSLNDVFAMGARGEVALALASVPLMAESMMEDDLYLLLKGAVEVLNEAGVVLVGGHTIEGEWLSLALTLTGSVTEGGLLSKGGLAAGQALVLTKAVGTGVVLAGHMRALTRADELAATVAEMDRSNASALAALRACSVAALTDVSGFGLLGHLGEMLRASGVGVDLEASAIPVLPGALRLLERGVASSLSPNNERALADYRIADAVAPALRRLLVDPQTSGGLLAGVPASRADECVAALEAAGYADAACIGRVTTGEWRIRA